MEDYNNYTFRNKDVDKMKRSQKLRMKSEKTLAKGKVAVDGGRDKKADRLHKKAARQENRSINVEDRERKKSGKSSNMEKFVKKYSKDAKKAMKKTVKKAPKLKVDKKGKVTLKVKGKKAVNVSDLKKRN
jgi:hypothetical protein